MKIFLHGASGRIGRLILAEILRAEDLEIVGVYYIDSKLPEEYEKLKIEKIEDINKVDYDCLIDFSSAEACRNLIGILRHDPKPMVIGTTGLQESDISTIKKIAEVAPVFLAENFSFGVAILNSIISEYSKKLKEFDVEILEVHHKKKLDSPSGTAIGMAENAKKSLDRNSAFVYDRNKNPIKREDIGIQSIRGGDIVGKHTIMYFGDGEFLEFSHTALNRRLYSNGAIMAARFLKDKKPSLYDMKDMASETEE